MNPQSSNVWTSNGPEGTDILSLAIDPINPSIIYAGGYGGLFRSNDGGASWNRTGLPASPVRSLAIDSNNTDILYAAAVPLQGVLSTVFKSTDGGASWHEATDGLEKKSNDLEVVVIDPRDSNILYAGARPGLFKSTDGGASWKQNNGLPFEAFGSLVIAPSDSNILYTIGIAPGLGTVLLKSTDGGTNWYSPNFGICPTLVAIDPRNPDVLYVDSYPGIAKSTNGGASWSASDAGLPDRDSVSALAIDPSNPNTIYAATYNSGVFRSTDGGGSWSEFNVGLTHLAVLSLVIDSSGNYLHAGTDAGVFDYQQVTPCADWIFPTDSTFEAGGGTSNVDVTAGSECGWTATSYASWISITSGSGASSGNGAVIYSVQTNTSTLSRTGTLIIAARAFNVTQAGLPVRITSASVTGKKLFVFGENFDDGAVILLNGEEQKTKNDDQNPKTALIGKKAGKKTKPGDKLQVRNPNGTISGEFTFTGI